MWPSIAVSSRSSGTVRIRRATQRSQELVQDLPAAHALGDRLVSQAHAVEHHVLGEGEEVLRDRVMAAVHERARTRRFDQRDARARAATQLDRWMDARAADEVDHVID